jgi:NADH-quinone oxidoreductase subunit A
MAGCPGGCHGTGPNGWARTEVPPILPCPSGRSITTVADVTPLSPYAVVGLVVLTGVALFLAGTQGARLLRPSDPTAAKLTTYECGVDPVGQGWAQTQVRYYLYAYLYVVFAVDAMYLLPWATVLRLPGFGWATLAEMGVFLGVLAIGLAHAWRRGLLRWV